MPLLMIVTSLVMWGGESTCRVIFKTFINNFANLFYGEYVKWPEDNDLMNSMEVYRRLGFPGCFGSISRGEYEVACGKGMGGYCIPINSREYLDCFRNYQLGNCMASFANSNHKVRVFGKPTVNVTTNTKIVVSTQKRTVMLRATKNIAPHTELLLSYGPSYVFPAPQN
jgi:hypothetical protein